MRVYIHNKYARTSRGPCAVTATSRDRYTRLSRARATRVCPLLSSLTSFADDTGRWTRAAKSSAVDGTLNRGQRIDTPTGWFRLGSGRQFCRLNFLKQRFREISSPSSGKISGMRKSSEWQSYISSNLLRTFVRFCGLLTDNSIVELLLSRKVTGLRDSGQVAAPIATNRGSERLDRVIARVQHAARHVYQWCARAFHEFLLPDIFYAQFTCIFQKFVL